MRALKRCYVNWLARWGISLMGKWRWYSLYQATKKPQESQARLLFNIISANESSHFGKDYDFNAIATVADFQRQVPIQTYESLRKYVKVLRETQQPVLTQEKPILYAQTSGTTGEPKFIPLTETALSDYKKQQQLVTYQFYQACPQAFSGDVLAIVSPAIEGYFETGIPYGSASGSIHDSMPRFVRARYVVPHSVFGIDDYNLKYQIIVLLALANDNISYIACANPSTLVRLLEMAKADLSVFIQCIESGAISFTDNIDDPARAEILSKFTADPVRAAQLKQLVNADKIGLVDLWPNLKLITTWTSGSCGMALSAITQHLPETVRIMDIGYLASEMRATVTIDIDTQSGLPLLQDHFYEFAETKAWDRGDQKAVLLHELEMGKDYYLIVTTKAGLYRYFMNDIVAVTGKYQKTPLLKFLQKGRGVTNITGEKLYEAQLLGAVSEVLQRNKIQSVFVMGLADLNTSQYQVFIETKDRPLFSLHDIAGLLDLALCQRNLEYRTKRESGRLKHLEVYWLRTGSFEAYKSLCLQLGQREGQFKTVALQYKDQFPFSFDQYIQY
jgi:hypothetical protein